MFQTVTKDHRKGSFLTTFMKVQSYTVNNVSVKSHIINWTLCSHSPKRLQG